MKEEKKKILPTDPISDEAMARLAQLMNDSPTLLKLQGTEWEIKSLKPGTQWLISEEACKIIKNENLSLGDVILEFGKNISSVCRVITLALINDKSLTQQHNPRYDVIYEMLMWGGFNIADWATLLFEILKLIDVDFFFASTDAIATIRKMTLTRKMTMEERGLSTPELSGDR